jgi:hypothetical protein
VVHSFFSQDFFSEMFFLHRERQQIVIKTGVNLFYGGETLAILHISFFLHPATNIHNIDLQKKVIKNSEQYYGARRYLYELYFGTLK